MSELAATLEPKAGMAAPYAILEVVKKDPIQLDGRDIAVAQAKFEEAFFAKGDTSFEHKSRQRVTFVDAAKQAVEDPEQVKDRKGWHVRLPIENEAATPWTDRVNDVLGKIKQEPLADNDVVVKIELGGAARSENFVVLRETQQG